MIYQLYSDLPTFKEISFHKGMNIIVAEKSHDPSSQLTRNKTGKTSFVEIINFILGSNCGKNCIFSKDYLKQYTFSLEFDLKDSKIIAERCGGNPNQITIIGEIEDKRNLLINDGLQENVLKLTEWREKLGISFFNLPVKSKKEKKKKYQPTFRSLFPYFARRENEGGIVSHERYSKEQKKWNQQVAISYLMGLDWTISKEWENLREREKALKQLKKAIGEGTFGEIIGTVSQLRTSLAISEEKVVQLERGLQSFQVLPQYEQYENEASELTIVLADLANQNTIDSELIKDLNSSLENEKNPSYEKLEQLYKEFGIVFPSEVSCRFEEVKIFHDTILNNRKLYLQSDIESAKKRISERDDQKKLLIDRRAKVMSILNSHGALDQFTKINSDLTKLQVKTESLRQKYQAAEQLEGKKTEMEIERSKLLNRLRQNFQEQEELMKHIILTFEDISSRLYKDPGSLLITDSSDGPHFEIKIQGERSKGIRNMQIFCFDMMLMILSQEKGIGPGFLIHDSQVFDGVDENQKATAFQIGAEMAQKYDFQYIVTMNSCDMPSEYSDNFNIDEYILPVGITDAKEDGGLFGFIF